ncbi:hypothetical protein CHGG_08219 [Chaetomium globosum CBS 148.51]|uniref:NB-ARC domain-containing protein n=1 Tax=Chaetomium globosum (strain ATCC 6205 / CBS 148.51 / DSM 1962 / NBRC 6347 / NRRL 1970) TaxID=306901 RepID=Q2GUY5_CHAGB|nr:uncharacterized protein CHGG_08219 [Chaetomium globosum CBS 148.51]EAQ86966.1 hypothetical protein CHGG_08219 [Chaetomium globosum CBS 148.51]
MPLGLECLHDLSHGAKREDHLVDIVAVHDVHQDSLDTWTHQTSGINWLRDLLPQDVRVGRILSYGYDSSASTLLADDGPETIQRMAESFVQELRADRQFAGTLRRPIVFVCHGMGGVLVKKSLVYASTRTAPKVAHLWDHYVSTFAIIFFGTPHRDVDKSSWLDYEAMYKSTRHQVGAFFRTASGKGDSQMPRLVDNDFAPLVKQFHLFFFWEQLPTRLGSRSALLVDHQSAAPKLDNTETAGIHAAHPDMCKFGSRASSDYRTVIAALVTYCEKAPGIISRRWRQAEGALKQLRLGEVEEIGGFGFDVHLEQPYRSQDIRSQGDLIHFHIPEETSPTFVGREDLLRTLRSAFFPGDSPTTRPGRKSFVIFGMGGSGKTELCSKFATDNKLEYTAVFTIRAASPETVKESYCSIGQLAGLEPTEGAGKHVLSQQKQPWLLIIDNADDRSLKLARLFPPGGSAHILITTRVRDFSQEGTLGSLELKGLKEAEALQLLLTKADIPRPWDSSTTKTARLIAKALGYLALALIQAGTCVYRGVCELGGYLEIHSVAKRRQRKQASGPHNDPISDVIEVVYSTFDVSLGVLEKHESVESRDATELLKMMAFFHFEFIPLQLFSRAVLNQDNAPSPGSSASWASSLANDLFRRLEPPAPLPGFLKAKDQEVGKQRLRFALADLQSLSFIRFDGKYISLHPLIHSWARDSLTTTQSPLWASIALHTIMRSISLPPVSNTKEDGEFHRDILPHLETCLAVTGNPISPVIRAIGKFRLRISMFLQPTFLIIIRDQVRMHAKCGWVFAERGHFDKAVDHLRIVREMLVKLVGEENEKTMNATLGLAGVLWGLGRLEEGINLGRSVVETRTRIYGPRDERTLGAMNKLGQSYWLNGQYREALELQETTSERMKEVLGESHPTTLEALDSLGVTLGAWHRFQESHDVHRFVLAARIRSLGPTHLDTLSTKSNLAMALLDLGLADEAEAVMIEVYTQRQSQLGKEHPWTLWALSYLCKIHIHRGQLTSAEELLTWGLAAATRSLGHDHLGVLMGRGHLAVIYARTGRLEAAERLSEDTAARVERSRGAAHPDCVYALWRLARLHVLRGARARAADTCDLGLRRAALRISIDHPLAVQLQHLRDGLRDPDATTEGLLALGEREGGNLARP